MSMLNQALVASTLSMMLQDLSYELVYVNPNTVGVHKCPVSNSIDLCSKYKCKVSILLNNIINITLFGTIIHSTTLPLSFNACGKYPFRFFHVDTKM